MKRYSIYGGLTAVLFALLPFASSRHLFHAAINVKMFLVVFFVLILGVCVAGTLWYGKNSILLKNRPLLWSGLALLSIYWLSALLGIFPERSIFSDILRASGVYFLTHVAALSLILGEFLRERDWTLIRRTIAVSTAVYAALTIVGSEGFGLDAHLLWMNTGINGFTFGNTTFAGTYLLVALVVTLIEIIRTPARTRWWYTLAASAALTLFSPILMNIEGILNVFAEPLSILGSARASSGSALLLLAFFAGYLLLRRYAGVLKTYAIIAWGSLFVIAVIAGVALLFTPGSIVQEKYVEASTGARILVWQSALQSFVDRPVLGWGPENFEQAHQWHFDNRLYQDEYIGEVWFDRAHNVMVDTLVSVGIVGALAHVVVIGAFITVVYRARKRDLMSESEAVLLFALPVAHFLQLQTGFDTIGSYVLLGVMGGYGLWLERMMLKGTSHEIAHAQLTYYKLGACALGLFIVFSAYYAIAELNRQYALYRIFVTTNPDQQLALIEKATERISAFEILRLSSLSLVTGTLDSIGKRRATEQTIETSLAQIDLYEKQYRSYIAKQPDYYRARMALAYLLSVELVLGGKNDLGEAKELVTRGHELSPENLLTPAMEALLELYGGNPIIARQKAEEIVALNPNAPFGHEVLEHIKKQEKTFPNVSVLQLENL
ncbi:hypothetical protein C4568_01920 [Candidatus Parcubacteria bacterium]|nr:MAG: hypothetical protein C4568_01920 [Candidatus Parcubacteria bacterium]